MAPLCPFRLQYDHDTRQYGSAPGVETRVPGFGDTSSIEYLDPNTKFWDTTNYFHDMVQHFVDKGYVRGKNIVGAPYDWRYSPSKFTESGLLQRLISTDKLALGTVHCLLSGSRSHAFSGRIPCDGHVALHCTVKISQ